MPSLDIRSLVMKNLSGSTADEIREYIQDTIDSRQEAALPGMGILFETVWKKSDEQEKNSMMDKIMTEINKVPVT